MKDASMQGYCDMHKVNDVLTIPQQPVGKWNLTNHQIVSLAEAISSKNLEDIAMGFWNISFEEVSNLKWKHKGDQVAFKRSLLQRWLQEHPGPDSAKVSAFWIF